MRKSLLFFAFVICSLFAVAQIKYPATKKEIVTDTYWGTTYKDSYRWMEDMKDTAVVSWFKKQADLTNSVMSKISGRDELIAEWKKLDKAQPPVFYFPIIENGRVFYQKRMPGEKVSKVYYRESIHAAEQLLFDPLSYIKGRTLSVQQIVPSYDGKKLAISYSESGAEVSTIKVMNMETRKFLPDSIYPTAGVNGWTFDNKALLYIWLRTADNADPTARLNTKTKLHIVGADTKKDVDFFSNASYPSLKIDPSVYPFASLSRDSRNYVFAGESSVQNEMKLYYAPISEFNSGKINWKVLCTPNDKLVRGMEIIGDKVYAITYSGAKNYKLVATDLKNPDWKNAKVIAVEKKLTLESITHSKDFLFLTYSDGINNHLYKFGFKDGIMTEIKLPFSGTASVSCLDTKTNDCLFSITSWNKPFTEYAYDAATDQFSSSQFNQPAVYPDVYKDLIVEEVEVKGHDGTMIPLSIIYKKGLKKDGTNVCLMDSYGAYGYSMTPYFNVRENSLAVKGVVVAIPHVRGGSEKGEDWYKAGFKNTKPNTWKDFISCAEYLISKGYTSSSRLSGTGTSAGGILISRAITERPDLFAAAICNVGCANALRLEFGANGPVNIPEFGTVKDSLECKALYAMDGMQHVADNTKYPAVICVTGWNDPRVIAWQPGKFAAALQNASVSDMPVLLKVNYDNGHFTEDKDVTFSNFADQFAFVMWQCGHPDFQLKDGIAPGIFRRKR
ncbi:MAG: prolyl oligopeptidase family serine peptidase [Prolixibacteraceae bacterium]